MKLVRCALIVGLCLAVWLPLASAGEIERIQAKGELVVAVLVAAGIPLAGLPLIFGVDRLFDMMRTSTNVLGDASCAVIINRVLGSETVPDADPEGVGAEN